MKRPRILFITPAATRSGAPMLMLHLVRYVKTLNAYDLAAVLDSDGAMTASLSAELPTQVLNSNVRPPRAMRALLRSKFVARKVRAGTIARCKALVKDWPPDVVFCNSVGATGALDALGPFSCPVVLNVHELEHVLQSIYWVPGGALNAMKRHATHYIAGSDAVRRNLIARHAISTDRVKVVHDFISASEFPVPVDGMPSPADPKLLESVGVPADAVVIGAIATVEWRKGADLFVSLARRIPEKTSTGKPIHLVWVGGGQPYDVSQFLFDIETAGLQHRVHAAGPTQRTADWYPAFTVTAMLSREDPFPLVALEAAACGVPIVCFAGGGGMPEFVEADAGFIVPYLDLDAFAEAALRLVEDGQLRRSMGAAAATKVRARHDVAVAAPQVLSYLQQVIDAWPGSSPRR